MIAAATDAHPGLILAAVEAGIPVFCEKPVAKTMAEGVKVLKAVEGSGVPIQIGYNRRFDAGFVNARAAVHSGELGKLHTVRSTTLDPAPPLSRVHRRVRGHLPGLLGPRLRHHPLGHRPRGHRGVRGRRQPGRRVHQGGGRRRHHRRDPDPRRRHHRGGVQLPPQRPGLRRPHGDPRLHGLHRGGPGGQAAAALGRTRRDLPCGRAARLLHGPVHGRLPRRTHRVHRGRGGTRTSPCTVADALEAGWIADACTLSLHEHRPVTIQEVREA